MAWLALSADGVVAGLLNRRTGDLPVATKRSRGELPLTALAAAGMVALMFVAILLLVVIAQALYLSVAALEGRLLRWQRQ